MAWAPVWKKNGSGVYLPLWITRGDGAKPAWVDEADPCGCCYPTFGNCTQCLNGLAGVGVSVSGYIDQSCDDTPSVCGFPFFEAFGSNLNGTYALTDEFSPNQWRIQLGTEGDCNDPGILIMRAPAPGFCSPRLAYYVRDIIASPFCDFDTLHIVCTATVDTYEIIDGECDSQAGSDVSLLDAWTQSGNWEEWCNTREPFTGTVSPFWSGSSLCTPDHSATPPADVQIELSILF